jgi:hypothetical protein
VNSWVTQHLDRWSSVVVTGVLESAVHLRCVLGTLKDRYGEPKRGGEWEPIKILLEEDGNSNKMNMTSYTHL